MKKIILISLIGLLAISLQAQKVYDIPLDTIQEIIVTNPGLYLELGDRFRANDPTLEGMDYLLLYYGSAYTEDYSPYGENSVNRALEELIDQEKYQEAVEMGLGVINDNPSFVEMYYNLSVSYHLQGDSLAAQSYFDKYGALLSIPFYSGNGLEKDSAFVVRSVADEYLILQEMGYRLNSQHLIHDKDTGLPYDLMKVVDEAGNEAEFYFNIYQPFTLGMAKIFGEDEEKKEDKKDKKKRKKKKKNRKN